MENQNAIINLPVDFAFRYWESLEIVRNTVVGYAGGMGFKVNSDDMSPEEWTYWAHAIPVTRADGHGQRTY
jgi:hypothetical protein